MLFVNCANNSAKFLSQPARSDDFTVSILREDGVLVPFAVYRNRAWSTPWPKPDGYGENDDNTLAELPKPWFEGDRGPTRTWYYWPSDDVPTVLKTSRITKVDNHCQSNWGLISDFPGKAVKAHEVHRNIGVALDVEKQAPNLLELTDSSIEWVRAGSFIQPAFDKAEDLKVSETDALHHFAPYPARKVRRQVKAFLIKLYRSRSAINGRYIFHFEARKEYKKELRSPDSSCSNISLLKGWMLLNERGDLMLLDSDMVLTDCDMKAEVTKPLGILTVGDQIFIITEDHGYEDESYVILELRVSGISRVIKTWGGGC